MAKTKQAFELLTDEANIQRTILKSKNEYKDTPGNEYGSTHPNALSDMDNKGKGENSGEVGGIIDKVERKKQQATNFFGPSNEYKGPF